MTNTETFPIADFDAQRVQQVVENLPEDDRVFIDPAYPDYMARRNSSFIKLTQDEAGKWDMAIDAYDGLGMSVPEVEALTQLNDIELQKLADCGLRTPERSTYTVVEEQEYFGPPRGVSYNYTRLIDGELLDPTKPEHAAFTLEYARAAVHYLAAKRPGELMLGDLYARNCMVGTPRGAEPDTPAGLFFVDTEPYVEAVGYEKRGAHVDNHGHDIGPRTEPSQFARHLFDIQETLQRVPVHDRAVQMEVATLLHKTAVELKKCGF